MTTPCEQTERIVRIEGTVIGLDDKFERLDEYHQTHGKKLDHIADALTVLAIQKERMENLSTQVEDHEGRIRTIEATPTKMLWWAMGIAAAVISGAVLHRVFGA